MAELVYGADRARLLALLLWVAVAMSTLMLGLGALALGTGSARESLVLIVPAAVLLGSAAAALALLRGRGRAARFGCLGAGVVLVLLGLFLAQSVVGFLPPVIGVLVLLLALLPDGGAR